MDIASTQTDRSASGVGSYENVIAIGVENHLKPTRTPSGNIPSPLGAFDRDMGVETPRIQVTLATGISE